MPVAHGDLVVAARRSPRVGDLAEVDRVDRRSPLVVDLAELDEVARHLARLVVRALEPRAALSRLGWMSLLPECMSSEPADIVELPAGAAANEAHSRGVRCSPSPGPSSTLISHDTSANET